MLSSSQVDADGSTVLVIGDVVGHDIGAAATMGQVRAVLRTCTVSGGRSPAQVLTATDLVIVEVSGAYTTTMGRSRQELVGRYL